MRKLRVGVWVGNKGYKPESGGAFGYLNQLIEKILQHNFRNSEVVFISNHSIDPSLKGYTIKWRNTKLKKFRSSLIKSFTGVLLFKKIAKILKAAEEKDRQKFYNEVNKVVDVIYYPTPECVYPDYPFIYTLWDSGHLSTYTFPEVVGNGEFERRKCEYEFIHKALMIFAESEAGRKEIEYYFRVNPDRIHVVPLFPSGIIDAKFPDVKPKAFQGDELFIHYPAQFWPHKNHYNLIQAFKLVKATFPSLKLVFTGSEKGNKKYIVSLINELGIKDSIVDLGFISMEELKWLYLNSKGLVMPTFLGPTNMPIMEAAELGCPVACSNLKGQQEQLGNYAYYFDPKNPREMANAITQMVNDKLNGAERKYTSTFNINNALLAIENAFDEIRNVRFTWQ